MSNGIDDLKSAILSTLYHQHILTSVKPELRFSLFKLLSNQNNFQTFSNSRGTLFSSKKSLETEEEENIRSFSDTIIKIPSFPLTLQQHELLKLKKVQSHENIENTAILEKECYEKIHTIMSQNIAEYQYCIRETQENVKYTYEENKLELKYINIGNLQGATLDKIVEWIGGEKSLEMRDLVIISYPNFTTSHELFEKIIKRFMIPWPIGTSGKEAAEILREKFKVIHSKILGFLQYWLTEKKEDFAHDRYLKILFEKWLEYMKKETIYYKLNKKQIETLIMPALEKVSEYKSPSKQRKMAFNFEPKEIPLPVNFVPYDLIISGCGILEFSAELIASQLALIDQKYFCNLTPNDFLTQPKPDLYNARQRLSERHNLFTSFITAYIIKELAQNNREALCEKFIEILKKSLDIGNLNSAFMIYSALTNYISRLKKTWPKILGKHKKFIESLDLLFSSDETYRKLREYTRSIEPPCVPCFYMWGKDMDTIFMLYRDDYVKGIKGMINLVRQAVIADKMKELGMYQKVKYNFYKVPILYSFLEEDFLKSYALIVDSTKFMDPTQIFMTIINKLE